MNFSRFTETPLSQTVRFGSDVILRCRADGHPRPQIEWWRNGQILQSQGRVFIVANNDNDGSSTLTLFAAKESDGARYICRAVNVNGFAETSADLRIINDESSTPKFTYKPHDMDAELGAIVELPCRAVGHPKPVIHWKKDGSAVEGSRYKISRGGSLYLYNVTLEDAGR